MKQQLLAILDNDNSRQLYRYLILDPLASISELDFIYLNNLEHLLGKSAITTIIRPELSHDLDSCPKLITLAEPNKELNQRIIHFSLIQAKQELLFNKRYVCSWLTSSLEPDIMSSHLIHLGYDIAKRCQTTFIPFYEPFRFQLLDFGNRISPAWLPNLLKGIHDYCYLTVANNIANVTHTSSQNENITVFLSEQAKLYQQKAKSIFKLYEVWLNVNENVSDFIIDDYLLTKVAIAYYKANMEGLTIDKDCFIFSLMSLRYGEIMKNEKIAKAVITAVNTPGSLPELFKKIPKSEFLSLNE